MMLFSQIPASGHRLVDYWIADITRSIIMSSGLALGFFFADATAVFAQLPSEWFTRPILPEPVRHCQMYSFVDANIAPLPKFSTLEQWHRYRAQLRPRLLSLFGIDDILDKYSLKVTHRGIIDKGSYTIEKIFYESYPGMYVPALVWAPKQVKLPAPAVVSISGHTYCDSKAADYVQARDYNLVQRGFIVVSYDYLGCFERGRRDACQPGVFGQEDHTNSLFSYTKRTPTGIEVLDGIRAVDYLYSRPDVDRTRIAFTGESGGGYSTYWVSALDERVTLSVPVSSSGALSQWIKIGGIGHYDWHMRPPGLRAFADIGTFYAMIAPRPLLVINGHPELIEFSLPDALRSVSYAKEVYQLFGKPNAISFHEATTGHGYQADKRIQLYAWLNQWFFAGKMPYGDTDLPYQPEPAEKLRVGLPADNLTIPGLARRWIDESFRTIPIPKTPTDAASWQRRKRKTLETLLSRREPFDAPGVIYRYDYQSASGPYHAEKLQFEVGPDLMIPGVLVRRQGQQKYKAVILLGKHYGTSLETNILVDKGYAVLCLDPRGTGEVDWGGNKTTNWADFTGRPPVGMWAEDISKVTTYLLARKDIEKVSVLGYGLLGKAALYAAALDDRISTAAVTLDTASYKQEATSGLVHVYADVPRILTWGDTPQLAALVAPRPLAILLAGKPVSYNGERPTYFAPLPRLGEVTDRISDNELRANYEWTINVYRTMSAEHNLQIGMPQTTQRDAVVSWIEQKF